MYLNIDTLKFYCLPNIINNVSKSKGETLIFALSWLSCHFIRAAWLVAKRLFLFWLCLTQLPSLRMRINYLVTNIICYAMEELFSK